MTDSLQNKPRTQAFAACKEIMGTNMVKACGENLPKLLDITCIKIVMDQLPHTNISVTVVRAALKRLSAVGFVNDDQDGYTQEELYGN